MSPIGIQDNKQHQRHYTEEVAADSNKTQVAVRTRAAEQEAGTITTKSGSNNNNNCPGFVNLNRAGSEENEKSQVGASEKRPEARRRKVKLDKQEEETLRQRRRSQRLLQKLYHQADEQELKYKQQRAMLSKIKSASAMSSVAGRTRASSFTSNNQQQQSASSSSMSATINTNSDTEDVPNQEPPEGANSDSNNNNLDNNNHQNQNTQQQHNSRQSTNNCCKKSQDELMDIVEVSRKRRLSKDSADSLSSFIRWSFGHISDQQQQQYQKQRRGSFNAFTKQNTIVIENNNNTSMKNLARAQHEDELLDDEDDWSTLSQHRNLSHHHHQQHNSNKFQTVDQLLLLRQQAKLTASGSSTANLLRQQQEALRSANKRPRSHIYSPDSKPFGNMHSSHLQLQQQQSNRKVSSYLGNVVDRLHQQKLQVSPTSTQQQPIEQAVDLEPSREESSSGLSFHLQQFLSQQTSLEDLCSSVGLDDSNQLVLAAAIHRALVDSVGPSGQQPVDSKSTASSTGGSSSAGSSSIATQNNNAINTSSSSSNGSNLHLIEALQAGRLGVGRRAYNTRGASGNIGSGQLPTRQLNGNSANSTAATLAALNINSRVQQQRHAQAAAALSALASAGNHHHQHHHSHSHQASHQLVPNSLNSLANVASSQQQQQQSQHPQQQQQQQSASGGIPVGTPNAAGGGNPMVDFECDTCGSSFDDRHRLMQHQSIHLELKKDWFKETPVDEVMKIFNRRRGEFLCNTCNLRFEATFDYDKHNHQVHGQRPYCCQFCGNGTRTFRFWRQYLNHLYDHRYIFSCTIDDCDFTVNRRDSLRFHIFRFHLNCQLPQQQTHIRSAGHGHNMLLNDSKWPALDDVDHQQGLDQEDALDDVEDDVEAMNMGD